MYLLWTVYVGGRVHKYIHNYTYIKRDRQHIFLTSKQNSERKLTVGYTFFFLKENKQSIDRHTKIKMDFLNQSFLSALVT